MTTIAIVPEFGDLGGTSYRAVAGQRHSVGRTPGEALDSLAAQLGEQERGTLVIVQSMRPDQFFTAVQQQRLGELMQCWRHAQESQSALPAGEQAELDALIDAEVEASTRRAADLLRRMAS